MPKSVCIRCGNYKNIAWKSCTQCGFNPTNDPDALARSIYLSVNRYDTDDERKAYEEELAGFASQLQKGMEINYDLQDIERLRTQHMAVESVSIADLIGVLFRFFLPAVLFLLVLIVILVILKSL